MEKKKKNNDSELYMDGIKAIAVNSLDTNETKLCRHWSKKYKLPMNDPRLLALTMEELLVEYMQDIEEENAPNYDKEEILKEDEGWLGETSTDHEQAIQKKLSKLPQVDLSKYKDNEKPEFEDDYK